MLEIRKDLPIPNVPPSFNPTKLRDEFYIAVLSMEIGDSVIINNRRHNTVRGWISWLNETKGALKKYPQLKKCQDYQFVSQEISNTTIRVWRSR
jgi:hypothetical protein